MAVPKATETMCRDSSVQARQGIQITPSLHPLIPDFLL